MTKLPGSGALSQIDYDGDEFQNLAEAHEKGLKTRGAPWNDEPVNPGLRPFQLFEAIAGMGQRARDKGTIALCVRDRKRNIGTKVTGVLDILDEKS